MRVLVRRANDSRFNQVKDMRSNEHGKLTEMKDEKEVIRISASVFSTFVFAGLTTFTGRSTYV